MAKAYIYFSTADWAGKKGRKISIAKRLRIARRFPLKSYHWFIMQVVRHITHFRLTHVAFGYDHIVLNTTLFGTLYWTDRDFILSYPTLEGFYVIPELGHVIIEQFEGYNPKPIWPTVKRYLNRGRTRSDDCVCVTCECLSQGGIDVPRNIVTPRQLYRFLHKQGYKYVSCQPENHTE